MLVTSVFPATPLLSHGRHDGLLPSVVDPTLMQALCSFGHGLFSGDLSMRSLAFSPCLQK